MPFERSKPIVTYLKYKNSTLKFNISDLLESKNLLFNIFFQCHLCSILQISLFSLRDGLQGQSAYRYFLCGMMGRKLKSRLGLSITIDNQSSHT